MEKELWLIWKQPKTRIIYKIGTLIYDNQLYHFEYSNPELNDAIADGFNFFPGFDDLEKKYASENLFANIETRLPNPARPDYLDILNYYNLEINSSQFEILKATRGRLVTDNYEFVPSFDVHKIEFDVAGTKYSSNIKICKEQNLIHINDRLILELESNNSYDKHAIKVLLDKNGKKYHLGYVPRYYSKPLTELLRNNVKYSALVESVHFESVFDDEDVTTLVKLIFKK